MNYGFPSIEEQRKIIDELESCFSVADEIQEIVEKSLLRCEKLRQSILKTAFEGKLVPQDPTDEPAEKLLERIKEQNEKRNIEKKVKSRRRQVGLIRYVK